MGALKEKLNSVQVEDYNELNSVVNDDFEEEEEEEEEEERREQKQRHEEVLVVRIFWPAF